MMPVAQTPDGSNVDPHTVIFPILVQEAEGVMRLVGTGFFLTKIGHFITAKHIFEEAFDFERGEQLRPIHALHFVRGSEVLVRSITKVSFTKNNDLAVGRMDYHVHAETGKPVYNRVPRFTLGHPAPGMNVVTYAYPESSRLYRRGDYSSAFRPKYYCGKFVAYRPSGLGLAKWPHFEMELDIKSGASGGPAFDRSGRVFGVNSSGGSGELEGIGRLSCVQALLDLEVYDFPHQHQGVGNYTVLELVRAGSIIFDPPLDRLA
jgi:Trypsin-like peptidase domain